MTYYLIKPNKDLQKLLEQNPHISGLSSSLYKEEDVGRSALSFNETIETKKLVFLAELYSYTLILLKQENLVGFSKARQLDTYSFIKNILGEAPYSRETFDRWWTIERISHISDYYDQLKGLSTEVMQLVEEINDDRLKAWWHDIIARKNNNTL
jgi:hypothetical protein